MCCRFSFPLNFPLLRFITSGIDNIIWTFSEEKFWLLYNVETNTINYHLKKVFADGELDEASVIRKFRITASDGKSIIQITTI